MNKHIQSLFCLILFLFIQSVSAQDESSKIPRVARFVTVGFTHLNFPNDLRTLNEFQLGYEQFISKKTSIIGAISYGKGNLYTRNIRGEILNQYTQRRYSISTGVRHRLINKGKFSFFGELQTGFRVDLVDAERRTTTNSGFIGLGVGAEYRFSDRIKATLGVNSQYSTSLGIDTILNPGLQIRLGK